jgi:hypothetical protein
MDYLYLGDKFTLPQFRRRLCRAVRKDNGKRIRGKNANMLVQFDGGTKAVVLARLLRKLKDQ